MSKIIDFLPAKIRLTSLFIYSICLALFSVSCQEKDTSSETGTVLELNLKKGDSYKIKSATKQEISQTFMGAPIETEQETDFYYDFQVTRKNKKKFEITTTYTRVRFYSNSPAGNADYDSETTPKDSISPLAIGYAALVGKSFDMLISSDGNIEEIRNVDTFVEELIADIDKLSPGTGAQARELLMQQFGEASLKKNMQKILGYFPQKPVSVGDKWNNNYVVRDAFPLELANEYTLSKIEEGSAFIDVNTSIKSDKDSEVELEGMNMTYDLSGTQSSKLELDIASGWITNSSTEQFVEGSTSVKTGEAPQPMIIPITLSTTSTVSQIK